MSAARVTMQPKSEWQKRDCIACDREATLEAVIGRAMVRCCDRIACRRRASRLARFADEAFAPDPKATGE